MKRKRRRHLLNRSYVRQIIALLICFVLLSSAIPAAAEEEAANNRTVKAGVFFFDGYHMRDSDGSYSGYGIELLNLISLYSHLNFEFVGYDNTWEEMQAMLLSGEIDVVTSARKTRQRTEVFGFSDPIERNSTVLSVMEDNTSIVAGDYNTYNGMTVGVLSGSSQNRTLSSFAQENGFTYQTREYDDSGELENALKRGEIDAILTSNLRRAENEKVLDTTNIDYFYAITRKNDNELLEEINYALEQMNLYEGDYWANNLYNKYYGNHESVVPVGLSSFTKRELDYIDAVSSGRKTITVTAMPDRRPYSYVEDGELKGILPQFFDNLMQMAGLPYEFIVPANHEEYEQLKESGGVDVVMDWQQPASEAKEYVDGGFLTETYMNTGTSMLTRKGFSGQVSSLAVMDGLVGLPLDNEQFANADIKICSSPKSVMQAVLNVETDAALMRTHTAQYFVNNDRTNALQLSMVDSDQIMFSMYVPSSSDHELVTLLNKCIYKVPDDVLSRLIAEYTSGALGNVAFRQYMAAHPGVVLSLSALVVLAIGVILFLYLRSRWNKKLLRTTEQSKQELEEQLAIVRALSRDYLNVYTLNMETCVFRVVKLEGYQTPSPDLKNNAELSYNEIMSRYIEVRVLDEDKDYMMDAISIERVREKLSTSSEYTGTYRIRTGEETHHLQFTFAAYRPEGQQDPLVLVGFRNIDDIVRKGQEQRALLEDALRMAQAASEAKTSFLSSVSHDIRTPMNAIIGFLTLMRNEVNDPEAVKEYIERIDAASQHLLGLINDVLDMNKIESGSTTLNLAEMNLAEIIAEINTIIQPQARAKNQTFEVFTSHLKFEHLMGDKMRINQVLINLLSNSVKYTQENGSIELRVEELPQVVNNYSRIRFTVSDDGMGMSEDYQKVIFEPFTREDTIATHEIQGTGLGMAITRSLVELMGGSIKVESKLGEGSIFTVELEMRVCEQEDDPRFWSDCHIARMIVVDDEEENCRNAVRAMTGVGVSTDYAVGGERAVQMVRDAQEAGMPYDMILLDWRMPGMNGLEAARLIRKDSKTPILLLTSYDWRDIEQEALEVGVNHFMPKPFFMSTFKDAVRTMMGRVNEAKHQESDVVNGMNILVVDDIEVNRIILVKILNTLGAECDTASNGQEAVEKFMNAPSGYDLILMDVQMPGMNGYEATRAIRASSHPFAKTIPIIAMTANAFVDDVRDAIESGMDAHIAKPVQIDKLKSTVQQVLDSRRTAKENV